MRILRIMTNKSSKTQASEVIFPEHCNHYGTLFGGQALQLLAKSAFLTARQFSRAHVVMAAVKEVQFLQPVPQGSVLQFQAWVVRKGRSSMTVCVHGKFLPSPQAERPELALEALFEMVAVDAQGKPLAIGLSLME